jgi:hypothetical protein
VSSSGLVRTTGVSGGRLAEWLVTSR